MNRKDYNLVNEFFQVLSRCGNSPEELRAARDFIDENRALIHRYSHKLESYWQRAMVYDLCSSYSREGGEAFTVTSQGIMTNPINSYREPQRFDLPIKPVYYFGSKENCKLIQILDKSRRRKHTCEIRKKLAALTAFGLLCATAYYYINPIKDFISSPFKKYSNIEQVLTNNSIYRTRGITGGGL
jgi:hypothetical protein